MPPLTRRRFAARFAALYAALPVTFGMAAVRARPGAVLAHDAPAGIDPAGYLVSEKYDGVRALWDGSTLRFRSGLPIAAPAWFTERLPRVPLDGELWLGRGRFEALSGTVRRQSPDTAAWQPLRYMVFELPGAQGDFAARAAAIETLARRAAWPPLVAAPQRTVSSRQALQALLDTVVQQGGEGLVLHRADAAYAVGRSQALLKLKPLHDAEALVLAHVAGRGKHTGRMGALRVRMADGSDFLIGTGFSDAQREDPPAIGTRVTFTYRGSTEAGIPRFASFLRVHSGL